jgi:hypothetical protein
MTKDCVCECGKLIPLGDTFCKECITELDCWFDDLFDGFTEDYQDA